MMRVAAVGDLHVGRDSAGLVRTGFAHIGEHADVLLLAGDLTQHGDLDEARILADELAGLPIPILAVLGNHDFHHGHEVELQRALEDAGVRVLEGATAVIEVGGRRLGVAGIKGFGGGFAGACASEFGEPEMKAFIRTTKVQAEQLAHLLTGLDVDVLVALTHYAPIGETLTGERLEIYPFLGSYLLGEAIDHAHCDLAVHGHAHRGRETGVTPGGVPVRNVARPVIQHAYRVYVVEGTARRAAVSG